MQRDLWLTWKFPEFLQVQSWGCVVNLLTFKWGRWLRSSIKRLFVIVNVIVIICLSSSLLLSIIYYKMWMNFWYNFASSDFNKWVNRKTFCSFIWLFIEIHNKTISSGSWYLEEISKPRRIQQHHGENQKDVKRQNNRQVKCFCQVWRIRSSDDRIFGIENTAPSVFAPMQSSLETKTSFAMVHGQGQRSSFRPQLYAILKK